MIGYIILASVLFVIFEVYECFYDSICYKLRECSSYKLRNVVRSIVGLMTLVIDAIIIFKVKEFALLDFNKVILFWVSVVLVPVHVLKSHFLFLCLQKKKTGLLDTGKNITENIVTIIDVIEYFLRVAAALVLMILNAFFGKITTLLLFVAAICVLCTRGKRMLEGDWMDFVFEDIALLAKRIVAKNKK